MKIRKTIILDRDTYLKLITICKQEKRSFSNMMNIIIEWFIENQKGNQK